MRSNLNKMATMDVHESYIPFSFIRTTFKNFVIYIPGTIIPAIVTLANIAIFTRVFPPKEYGKYTLVVTTAGFACLVLSLWIQQAVLRYRALYKQKDMQELFDFSFLVLLILITFFVLFFSIILYIIIGGFSSIYKKYHIILTLFILSEIYYSNFSYLLVADLKAKIYSLINICKSVMNLLFSCILVFMFDFDFSGLIWAAIITQFSLAILLALFLRVFNSYIFILKSDFHLKECTILIKRMFLYGFPLIGWSIATYILNLSDRYMIQIYKGSADVGIYSPNYNLVMNVFSLIYAPFIFAVHSQIMHFSAANEKEFKGLEEIISLFSRYAMILTIPFFFIISCLSRDIVNVFIGSEYRKGYIIMPIVMLGYLIWNFSMLGHKGLELSEKTYIISLYAFICALLNIALNTVFIPVLSYKGAAITSSLSLILYPILIYKKTKYIIKWNIPWKSILNSILSSSLCIILSSPFIFFHRLNSLLTIIITLGISGIFYFLFLFLLKEYNSQELLYIKHFFGNLLSGRR